MNYVSKKIKNTLRSALALAIGSAMLLAPLGGCKKSGGITSCDEVARHSQAFGEAMQLFYDDMSVANCQNVRRVGENYLNAARRCTLYPQLRQVAEEALAEWENFDCSEYED